MPRFTYKARDASGHLVEGSIEANDRSAAMLQIEQKRYMPIRIDANIAGDSTARSSPSRRPAPKDEATVRSLSHNHQFLFTEQLNIAMMHCSDLEKHHES